MELIHVYLLVLAPNLVLLRISLPRRGGGRGEGGEEGDVLVASFVLNNISYNFIIMVFYTKEGLKPSKTRQ